MSAWEGCEARIPAMGSRSARGAGADSWRRRRAATLLCICPTSLLRCRLLPQALPALPAMTPLQNAPNGGIPGIVRRLRRSSNLVQQYTAAGTFFNMLNDHDGSEKERVERVADSMVAAGAVPVLVQILRNQTGKVVDIAATILADLSSGSPHRAAAVVDAGALTALVPHMSLPRSNQILQQAALRAVL